MKIRAGRLPGVVVIDPVVHGDERGFFVETFATARYKEAGIDEQFVQDNLSRSAKGILRGLHLQHPYSQGKLCQVLDGAVFDVAIDLRTSSPTFGQWEGYELSSANKRQLYVPPGFAHGFCVTGESALFLYKCTEYYHPETEILVRWDDPDIGIDWPIDDPLVSKKDAAGLMLRDIPKEQLPND